jgi:hypothetical protein
MYWGIMPERLDLTNSCTFPENTKESENRSKDEIMFEINIWSLYKNT